MITLKMITVDMFILGLIAWGVLQFLRYKAEERKETGREGVLA